MVSKQEKALGDCFAMHLALSGMILRKLTNHFREAKMERVAGIEPAYSAWKAAALPLSYTRRL